MAIVANRVGEDGICDPSALSSTQERICEGNRDVVYTIAQGVEVGLAQCQDRFVARRWNCSVQPAHYSYFLTATQKGETAHASLPVTRYGLSYPHTCSIAHFYPHFYPALTFLSLTHTLPPALPSLFPPSFTLSQPHSHPLPSLVSPSLTHLQTHSHSHSHPPPRHPRSSLRPGNHWCRNDECHQPTVQAKPATKVLLRQHPKDSSPRPFLLLGRLRRQP